MATASTIATSITGSTGTATSNNYSPRAGARRTILGVVNELELMTGATPLYDTNSTLNAKYKIAQSMVPGSGQHPTLKYFGIGRKGTVNKSDDGTTPRMVMGDNLDIYGPLPFRCVPIENDLDADTRKQYRMRVPVQIGSDTYICYYLKVMSYTNNTVVMSRVNPSSQVLESYSLDYGKLTPTPPTTTIDGSTAAIGSEINIGISATLPITGAEILEGINVLYSGDLDLARITEIGLYTGTDLVTQGTDASGNSFDYTESIMAQLAVHRTWNGTTMDTASAEWNPTMAFGSGNIVILE